VGAARAVVSAIQSVPMLWLGLCWGLCLPLFFVSRPEAAVRCWMISLPVSAAAFALGGRGLTALLVRGGLSRGEARREMAHVALPLWIVGFSPAALFLPLKGLPLYLIMAAAAVSVYRLAALAREKLGAEKMPLLETAIFALLFCSGLFLLFRVQIVHDALQYYGYLASVALDGDLNLYDEIYIHNALRFYNPFPERSARFIGTAIMEAPWLGAAHLASALLGSAVRNGYSQIYGFFLTLASAFAGLGGLLITYRLCCEFFSRRSGMIAALATVFASPLVYFMYCWGGWAHPFAFFFAAAFLLYWQRTRPERSLPQWAVLGILAGAIAIIRPTAVLILMLPLLEWMGALKDGASKMRSRLLGPVVAAISALVVFSPQLAIWKALSGSWISAPYREVGDHYHWLSPELVGILFSSSRHGLFAWTPLLLAAAAGMFILLRRERLIGAGALIVTAGTIYIYACWSVWWTGIGFSNRFFIELTPLFALGLAALLERLQEWISRERLCALMALAVAWNLTLVGAYRANDIPQGIPEPGRVVDDPLSLSDLVAVASQNGGIAWLDWLHDGFFTEWAARALTFSSVGALLALLLVLTAVALAATLTVRLALARRFLSGSARGAAWCVLSALAVSLLIHGAIWRAAAPGDRIGRLHHIPETEIQVRQPAPDTWIYVDHPLPVSHVDLLTKLHYAHPIEQGEVVAEVKLYGEGNHECVKLLRAGIDSSEASFLRPEYRDSIRHGIEGMDIVRTRPIALYSKHRYEMLTFRSTIELPERMVVRKIRLRYLHRMGRLMVSDIFLRDFP
jgi:hypothetical protein